MATVTAISTKHGGGGKKSLEYICRDDKTENKKFVTALNCSLPTAYQEFKNTREMYNKTGGIRYYHFVQSHPSGYYIEPALAHKIAVEFAERAFKGHEVVVATHTDADHIHSHFILNAVNADTGLKYHSNKFTLQDLRQISDGICQKYGVITISQPELGKQTHGVTAGEYRSAMRGESWKMNLVNTIDAVMKRAKSKKQFRFYMKQYGYDVKWEDSRKYITYTCPNGRRCRDNKLHDARYTKEMMEYEFKIRGNESSLQAEYAGGTGHTDYGLCPGKQLAGNDFTAEAPDRYNTGSQSSSRRDYDIRTDETVSAKSADNIRSVTGTGEGDTGADIAERDGRGIETGSGDGEVVITGWETERADLIAAEMLRRAEQEERLQTAHNSSSDRAPAPDFIGGIAAVATLIEDEPDDDIEYAREHIDRKALAKVLRKKEELGMHMG
ncbi:relaxase/mobilization nuclease domain-containing protein [Ruminococcus sp.]|uniref:relaxase/mobilization nuclease domain-containing protein n=1 Tax=Ruminococcus sp. TaxID=41978 RepID=UPI0025CC220E|nr:relaxase/mobilization nuclease domain-containing protein [Ruminococcus sp.]MCR4639207.1 relaxase/mobilization nuclease domain-containing protein [Ruminococcus sp.]